MADGIAQATVAVHAERSTRSRRNKLILLSTSPLVQIVFTCCNYWLVTRHPGAAIQYVLMMGYYIFLTSKWVQWDAHERDYTLSPNLSLTTVFLWPVGVPWYLIATRGVSEGLKSSGLALLLLVGLSLAGLIGTIAGVLIFDPQKVVILR